MKKNRILTLLALVAAGASLSACATTENGTQNNKSQIDKLFNYLNPAFKGDLGRVEKIRDLKVQFDIINRPFPKDILGQTFKTTDGKYVTLAEIPLLKTSRIVG